MIRVRCEMRLALTRPDAPMPYAVLGGELRVRSDEREGVVLAAAIPVVLCDSAGVSPAATPLFRAPPLAMHRCDAGVNAAAALADEPAPAATSNSAPPLLVPEEDAGFAPFLPAEDRASLAMRNAESFESLKQHGELHTVMDLVSRRGALFSLLLRRLLFVCLSRSLTHQSTATIQHAGRVLCRRRHRLHVRVARRAQDARLRPQGRAAGVRCARQLAVALPSLMHARTSTDKLQSIHPDDCEQVTAYWRAAVAESVTLDRPVTRPFTFRIRRKDGSYIWVESASCITPTRWYGVRRCGGVLYAVLRVCADACRWLACILSQRHLRPQAA